MESIFDTISQNQNKEPPNNTQKNANNHEKQNDESVINDLNNKYNSLKNKSQSELMDELYSNVKKQKEDGTFDYQKLSSTLNSIMPFLGEEEKGNMKNLLNKIKD